MSFNIIFENPCLDASVFQLVSTTQNNPPDYAYTGSSPPAIFILNAFTIYPPICTVVYSCEMTTLAGFDLCEDGTFTASTGNLVIATESFAAYPPKVY